MAAPGTAPPASMQQTNAQQPGRGGFPANFQPPPNMPNINFSAPVIRLGTSGPAKPAGPEMGRERGTEGPGRRAGLGSSSEGQRHHGRDTMVPQPPTRDELVRTLFVGGITEGAGGDDGIERILQSAGRLRRWIRATDADEKPCRFGFAEFDDPESLETAVEILQDIEIPVKRQVPRAEGEEEQEVEKSTLLVRFLYPTMICAVLTFYRLWWTRAQLNTWSSSRIAEANETPKRSTRALRQPVVN